MSLESLEPLVAGAAEGQPCCRSDEDFEQLFAGRKDFRTGDQSSDAVRNDQSQRRSIHCSKAELRWNWMRVRAVSFPQHVLQPVVEEHHSSEPPTVWTTEVSRHPKSEMAFVSICYSA